MPDIPQKMCTKCGETKDETAFYLKHAARYPGLRNTVCKTCDSLRKRLTLAANREAINAKRQAARIPFRAQRNAHARTWLAEHAEQVNARRRALRTANPEKYRVQQRAKRARDPEKYRAQDTAHYHRTIEVHRERARVRYAKEPERFRLEQQNARAANPDRFQAYEKTKRLKHRDVLLTRGRQAYQKYRIIWNARKRAHYAENPQENAAKIRTYNQQWRGLNREKFAASAQRRGLRRRALKLGLPALFTEADRQFCYQYFGYACAICGHEEGFEASLALDHFIPLNDPTCPGTVPWNLIPLCHGLQGCNNSKQARVAKEWLEKRVSKRKAKLLLKKIEAYFEIMRIRHT